MSNHDPSPDWIKKAVANSGTSHYTPNAETMNRQRQPDPEASREGVKAGVAQHFAQTDAAGLEALDQMQQADAERERERIERLHRDHPYLTGGGA